MIGELAALGAAISWAVTALLYKKALSNTEPLQANILRLTLTGAALLLFIIAAGKLGVLLHLQADVVFFAVASGVIGLGLGDTLYLVSLKRIGVARTVPLTCTYPLFNLVWAALLVGEGITFQVVLGVFTIVFGIWLLGQKQGPGKTERQRNDLLIGVAIALTTAVLWSVSMTLTNLAVSRAPDLDHALAVNTMRVLGIAFSFLVAAPFVDRSFHFLKVNKNTMAVLIAGGIIALGVGWFLLSYSFVETLESRAVPISSTTPLFSTLAAILFLHEKVTAKTAAGSILVVVGIFMIFLI